MELAVAKLAFSTLSPIINKLGNYALDSNFGGDVTAEEMRYLNCFVSVKIMALMREVEMDHLDQLTPLLENLQAAAFEAEDLLDLYDYKQIKYQVCSSPNFIKKSMPIVKEKLAFMLPKSQLRISLEKLLKFADEIEKLHPFIKFKTDMAGHNYYKSPQAISTQTTSYSSAPYFGRVKQCDTIIKFLLGESHADSITEIKRVPIIAIMGLGGSGKTVTTQHVYNDDRTTNCFDLRMWVHVSHSFDVQKLTKEIIESATQDACPQINNLNVLQDKLKEIVSKRNKFILVLDDIWSKDKMQWDQLLRPLNEGGRKGSRIIITTRMEEVTSMLQVEKVISLEELKIEDCWSILKHYAFNNHEEIIEDQELINVGNQIISKVKYSPLALRVAGSSLSKQTSVYEWEKMLKRDMLKETRDVLLFSFQHLPSHLQPCFAYCSLFPKGYRFPFKNNYKNPLLTELWIAQGFVENTSKLTLEEEALIYVEELLSYSFFQSDSNSNFFIHDLLHDIAEEVSKGQCHRIEHGDSLYTPTTCIHLSIWMGKMAERVKIIQIFDTLKLRYLRTLIVLDRADSTDIIFKSKIGIFQNLTKLRVLYVADRIKKVLSNPHLGKLKHLRYLNVHHDKKLPRSLVKLYHLQFFHLITETWNEYLPANTLPQGFGNLINLRTLKFYGRRELDYLYYNSKMINIEKLNSLQNLSAFHPDSVNGMMLLKRIPLINGSIVVSNIENIKNKAESMEAMLNQKKNLKKLKLEWSSTSSSTDNSSTCEVVLEGLKPHSNLEILGVKGYQGIKVASWMIKDNWLPCLRILNIWSCKRLKEIPFFPTCLQELVVENCDELMQLPPFPNTLNNLQLADCPNLMLPSMSNILSLSLCDIRRCSRNELLIELSFVSQIDILHLEGFPSLQILPKLSPSLGILRIEDCPKLANMENLQYCTSLDSLYIYKCPTLVKDEAILVKVVEGDIVKPLSQVKRIQTDEPLLVLQLVQQQALNFIEYLRLYGLQRHFPPLLEDHFHQLSNIDFLHLIDFKTLPNLEMLSSLKKLIISYCPNVKLLPNLPISLLSVWARQCPKLKMNYKTGGRLRHTISHIPDIAFT